MKKISLLLVVSILVLNVVTISSLAAVQSDAEAGQWAKTYVFDDFNQKPTGKTVTYNPNGEVAWPGGDATGNENANFYRGLPSLNTIGSSVSSNVSLVMHPYGWNTNTANTDDGKVGWFGTADDGFYGFASKTSATDMKVLGWSGGLAPNASYTPQSNLEVNWNNDTVEVSYDYLWSLAQDTPSTNSFLMTIYDTYYDSKNKLFPSAGRRVISYLPQVLRVNTTNGAIHIKVFDGNAAKVILLDKASALEKFNIDTSYSNTATGLNPQWIHMSAVISKNGNDYISKYYINGRPITGSVTLSDNSQINLEGSYKVTLSDLTTEGYVHKGISYYATGRTPNTSDTVFKRQLYNGIDNIRFVKYNSNVTMPSEMTIDSDTSSIVIPFTNNYYTDPQPVGVKAAAVDLSSFTVSATKNGIDISDRIIPDYDKTARTSTTTTYTPATSYITQDGKSLKLKGITSNPGDTIVIKLNGIKDITGKALENDTIILTNPVKVSVSDFKIDENGKATALVKNNATSEQKCIFVIGDYKDAATLIAANISDVTLQAGESKNIEVSITKADEHSSYKAFIWDKTDLTPYADSIEK